MDPEELELLAARARLEQLIAELGIESSEAVRSMLDDPAASVPLLEHTRTKRGLANPAAWAVSRWRRRREHPLPVWPAPMPVEPEHPDPLTSVADIEGGLRWARMHRTIVPAFVIPNLERELLAARLREDDGAGAELT